MVSCRNAEKLAVVVTLQWLQLSVCLAVNKSISFADWMGNLSTTLRDKRLSEIAIPGSHDSGSYSLRSDSEEIVDNDKFSKYIELAMNSSKKDIGKAIYRWSKTQDLNITCQLTKGIRYLDLRIAVSNNKTCYVEHRLLGTTLFDILNQVKEFIENHTKEIIILDVNHIFTSTKVTMGDARSAISKTISNVLGYKVCPVDFAMKAKLSELWRRQCNVLIVLPSAGQRQTPVIVSPFNERLFAQKSSWLSFLDWHYYHKRPPGSLYVTQGIMQPHWMEIAVAGMSEKATLKNWVSDAASREMVKWLKKKQSGKNRINIVIVDFVEDHHFVDNVLAFNCGLTVKVSFTIYLMSLVCSISF